MYLHDVAMILYVRLKKKQNSRRAQKQNMYRYTNSRVEYINDVTIIGDRVAGAHLHPICAQSYSRFCFVVV